MERKRNETEDRIVPPCKHCTAPKAFYRIEDILHPNHGVTQTKLNTELSIHNHPKSRDINDAGVTHKRKTHEAARELADHYIYAHNFNEPELII